jgi:hypothetical protein
MNAYPILGLIVTFVPIALIVTIVVKRGRKLFDSD